MDWYLKVLKNYVGFRGRARRKEYWIIILVPVSDLVQSGFRLAYPPGS